MTQVVQFGNPAVFQGQLVVAGGNCPGMPAEQGNAPGQCPAGGPGKQQAEGQGQAEGNQQVLPGGLDQRIGLLDRLRDQYAPAGTVDLAGQAGESLAVEGKFTGAGRIVLEHRKVSQVELLQIALALRVSDQLVLPVNDTHLQGAVQTQLVGELR